MPNWTEQQLHVVGRKADIDRFVRVGYTPRRKGELDALLHFDRLCPKPSPDAHGAEIGSGVTVMHWRTTNQACFDMITPWDYPAWFYESMAAEWPTLAFCCSVSGEMGDFGGIVSCVNGEFIDLVRDFDGEYDRRAHLRAARSAMKRWMTFLTRDRDWRLMPNRAWEKGNMRADAHFDGDFWYYFRSREAMADFRGRHRCRYPERRVDGAWKRTRAPG
ncbi:MAG: hypothetical protein IT182_16895 [Acidobacteria bacterium]|nr:hypothetical protein [Acidobacteriota bacterium]